MTTPPRPTYRRVCIVAGERYDVIGPDGKQVGFIRKDSRGGWAWRGWGSSWQSDGDSLDEAFANVVTEHGEMEGERCD